MALIANNISGSASNSSRIGITGSVVVANVPGSAFPTLPGDIVMFVSGAKNSLTGSTRGGVLFGGDVRMSGSLVQGDSSGGDRIYAWGVASMANGFGTAAEGNYSHAEGYRTRAIGVAARSEGWLSTASVDYSHAEGYQTIANGLFAHAEGGSTLALGTGVHTEGYFTTGSGIGAHAEGYRTVASGNYTHVEGYESIASGSASHAEGSGSIARGIASHAEGHMTSAEADYTHAEGYKTHAFDTYAHAEGYLSTGSGYASHAEGYQTKARGTAAHSEGWLTDALGSYSHAEGWATKAQGDYSHAEGYLTTGSGLYSHAEGESTRATAIGSHAEGYLTTASAGYSHAQGYLSTTTSTYSLAAGIGTITSGSGQTAMGQYNSRNNNFSLFVVGNGTGDANANRSDVLRVNSTRVEVTGSLAATLGLSGSLTKLVDGTSYLVAGTNISITSASNGAVTIANTFTQVDDFFDSTTNGSIFTTGSAAFRGQESAVDSPADKGTDTFFYVSGSIGSKGGTTPGVALFGGDVQVSGSLTVGSASIKVTSNDIQFGDPSMRIEKVGLDLTFVDTDDFVFSSNAANPKIIFSGSLQRGQQTLTNGLYSHAEGESTVAVNVGSHAEGYYAVAKGDYSHAEGYGTRTDNSYSHSEGYLTTGSGLGSHAEGFKAKAQASYSHAEGDSTTADGIGSHAEGWTTTALAEYSHAEGKLTIAQGDHSHAEGLGTFTGDDAAHAEGRWTTAEGVGSHAEGYYTFALSTCHAEGSYTHAGDTSSHAEGYGTRTGNSYSHAEGYLTTGSGLASHAEGSGSIATGIASHAEGGAFVDTSKSTSSPDVYFTSANGTYSHAEGVGCSTNTAAEGSHAEGFLTQATGSYSHAEGGITKTIGIGSHAEGRSTVTEGSYSHAEGLQTDAIGNYSHAEGLDSIAEGTYSHAEGSGTKAYGLASHASGLGTVASGSYQTVIGKYNIGDNSADTLFIVGKGASGAARDDAFSVTTTYAASNVPHYHDQGPRNSVAASYSINDASVIQFAGPNGSTYYAWGNIIDTGPDLVFAYGSGTGVSPGYGAVTTLSKKLTMDAAAAGTTVLSFTGQHRCSPSEPFAVYADRVGMIVRSTGVIIPSSGSMAINDAIPQIELTSMRNDKRCFGVVSDSEDTDDNFRKFSVGRITSYYEKNSEDDNRIIVNSLGEGCIWVCNVNGNLENGDYITTCEIPGHGMKQNDDLLHSYTVAKITMDCSFDLNSTTYRCEEIVHEGVTYRRAFVACSYHCG